MALTTMKPVYFAFCFFLFLTTATCQVRLGEKVKKLSTYPYQARLKAIWYNQACDYRVPTTCSGTIVGRNFVLTAGHCVPERKLLYCTRIDSNGETDDSGIDSDEETEDSDFDSDEETEDSGIDSDEETEEWHDRVETIIYLGTLRQDGQNNTQEIRITAYAFNNDYRWAVENDAFRPRRNNDIALVRTAEPIRFKATKVAPAVLGNPQGRSRTGWQCRISGWGRSNNDELIAGRSSEYLRHAWNQIKSPIHCGTRSKRRYEIDTEICTEGKFRMRRAFGADEEGEPDFDADMILDWVAPSTTLGDSGGPLSCRSGERHTYRAQHMSVYGVVSYGDYNWPGHIDGCCTYFTRVAAHVDWISQQFQLFNEERRDQEGHVDEELLLDGRHAAMGQFPYQVVIERQGAHNCSGAIIDKRWVVSAAGCFRLNHEVTAGLVNSLVDNNEARQTRTCVRIERRDNLELCQMDRRFSFLGRFVKKIKFARTPEIEVVPEDCLASSWELNNNQSSNHLTYKEANIHWPHDPLDVAEINRFDQSRTGPGAPLVCTTVYYVNENNLEPISDDERYYTAGDDDKSYDDDESSDNKSDDKIDDGINDDESFITVINDEDDSIYDENKDDENDDDESDYYENDDEENDDKYRHLYGINVAILRNGDWRGSYVNVKRHSRWIQQIIGY